MSAEIVPIVRSPDGALIERIEQLLERVRNGEIDSIAYATVTPDGGIGAGYSIGGSRALVVIASTERLLWRLKNEFFK